MLNGLVDRRLVFTYSPILERFPRATMCIFLRMRRQFGMEWAARS